MTIFIPKGLEQLPTPEPVPDTATYLAERARALAWSTERQANWDRYNASSRRDVIPDYQPVRIDFENVSRCNFRCTMCQVSDWHKGQRATDMNLEDFEALLDSMPGLVEIKIQGFGEPVMQGDTFFAMIRAARARHLWVRTTTNASLLHLKDNHRKLIDSGVNEIQISIDGADEETYCAIRRGADFHRVIDNCRRINAYSAELGIERTKMWTVVQRGNRHQLADLVRLGADIGFRSMGLSLALGDFGQASWRDRNEAVSVADAFTFEEGQSLIALGDSLGIKVRFWIQSAKYSTKDAKTLCPWPFERVFVSSDLRIVPCCILGNPEVLDLGDARTLATAWQSDKALQDFRRAHLEGDIPEACRPCYED